MGIHSAFRSLPTRTLYFAFSVASGLGNDMDKLRNLGLSFFFPPANDYFSSFLSHSVLHYAYTRDNYLYIWRNFPLFLFIYLLLPLNDVYMYIDVTAIVAASIAATIATDTDADTDTDTQMQAEKEYK